MAWRYIITDTAQAHYSFSDNAEMVYANLFSKGYSVPAIIDVLANMEHESYLNLGQQELGKGGNTNFGYGLVQWTPARTKILEYAIENNINWYDGTTQMSYFDISVSNEWISTAGYPYTLSEFKTESDIYRATRIFFYNFERGTWTDALDTYAVYWNNYFGGEPPTPPTPIDRQKLKKLLLMSRHHKRRI